MEEHDRNNVNKNKIKMVIIIKNNDNGHKIIDKNALLRI